MDIVETMEGEIERIIVDWAYRRKILLAGASISDLREELTDYIYEREQQ